MLTDSHTDATVTPVAVIPTPDQSTTGTTPLRVLHVINGEHFSGAERVQSHLARRLPEFGVHADFVCLTPGRFPEHFDVPGSQLLDARMKNRFDFSAVTRVARMAADGGYDLLHAHTPRSAMIASLAADRAGLPWVYHVHSPASADSTRSIRNRVNALTEQFCLRTVSHQIVVSNSLNRHTVGLGYDPHKVTTVHNGVPGIRPKRSHFPEVGGTWNLGIVALHRPRKGLEVLLKAISIVRGAGYDVRLRCIGSFETPGYESDIRKQVESLGLVKHVDYDGFVRDIPAALVTLDAMVLPSLFGEGLPMVVLEAMAAALPIIATRVEGTPEAIHHDIEGLLAEAGDADSLAQQIQRLVSGEVDWHRLADAAADRHRDEFSDIAMAQGVAAVYRTVVSC